jgi:hypothetical protein
MFRYPFEGKVWTDSLALANQAPKISWLLKLSFSIITHDPRRPHYSGNGLLGDDLTRLTLLVFAEGLFNQHIKEGRK